jgi:hypothetical protein
LDAQPAPVTICVRRILSVSATAVLLYSISLITGSSKRARQLAGTIDMLLAAKRTGVVEFHLRIQHFVSGFVDNDAPIFKDTEICTLKHFVLGRANKDKFQRLFRHDLTFCDFFRNY